MLDSASPLGSPPKRMSRQIGILVVLVSTVSVAGCATRAPTYARAPVYQPPAKYYAPARVAGFRHKQKIVIEDDGMEEQIAPPLVRKPVVDDPTEPFSPNYGRSSSLKRADASGPGGYVPNELPEEFRTRLAKARSGT